MPWQQSFERGLREGLKKAKPKPKLFIEYLDAGRFPETREQQALQTYLTEKYASMQLDVVIAESRPASTFLSDKLKFFPGAKRIFVQPGFTPGMREQKDREGQVVVPVDIDLSGAIQEMQRLSEPQKVYVVADASSPTRLKRLDNFKSALDGLDVTFQVEFLVDLPMGVLLDRISRLPERSAIFYLLILSDGTGKRFIPYNALQMIAEHANAPIYSHWDTLMGSGMLGGYLLSGERIGQIAARSIDDLIQLPTEISPRIRAHGLYYDWRQMKRWGIDRDLLGPDATLLYYEPNVFEEYRWQIIITLFVLIILSSLSIGLVIVNRKRKQAVNDLMIERSLLEERVAKRTASLQKSEKGLSDAQHIAHIGSWSYDLENKKLLCSDEVYRIFGIVDDSVGELLTLEDFFSHIHPGDREYVQGEYQALMESGQAYDIEHRILRSDDGEIRRVHARCENQFDDTGKAIRSDGTVQDITDRLQMEEMLRQSEKMATLTSLAAGMAHELNNPLGSMVQSAQNIKRRLSPQLPKNQEVAREVEIDLERLSHYMERREIFDMFRYAAESGSKASAIINDLITLSKKSDKVRSQANMNSVIEGAIAKAMIDYDLKQIYHFDEIVIVRDFDPNLPDVLCQMDDIQNTILAILRNAAQAMPGQNRPPQITVRTRYQDQTVCIEIEDNGTGIEDKVLNRIFEPLFTTHSPQHQGLGLSTAYSIVCRSHQGRMRAESELNIGTKIIIELPVELV
ncbi:MAG: ATP-binding protein [Sedimenticola sp.]